LVERLYGPLAFAVVYVAAGIGGALASVAASPVRVSVGASGAICGVLGALLAFLVIHRRTIAGSVRNPLLVNLVGIVAFMAILGFFVPNIDNEAHLGGLVTGIVCGLLLSRPWPVIRVRRATVRRASASIAIALALLGAAALVMRRGTTALPPVRRYQDLADQIGPALAEYNDIVDAMPVTLVLSRDRDDPEVRAGLERQTRELTLRARTNLARLRSASTPYSGLRVLVDDLKRAQSRQIESLDAALKYLDTGSLDHLKGEGGVLDRRALASREIQAFQNHQETYLREHGVATKPAEPKPPPAPSPVG
jgi:rhomboid protease GluP